MTDSEKELRDLAKAATPGEWRAETDGGMNPLMPWRIARPLEPRHETTARRPYHALYSTDADARFAVAANPAAVLALLDRIEALENQAKCIHGEDRTYCERALNDAVDRAERKGAEEMKTQCVALAKKEEQLAREQSERPHANKYGRFDYWDGRRAVCRALAKWVGDLPLPGDAP